MSHLATIAEADQEFACNVGREHSARPWILSDRDVWYANPFYTGPRVPHPEEDFETAEEYEAACFHLNFVGPQVTMTKAERAALESEDEIAF